MTAGNGRLLLSDSEGLPNGDAGDDNDEDLLSEPGEGGVNARARSGNFFPSFPSSSLMEGSDSSLRRDNDKDNSEGDGGDGDKEGNDNIDGEGGAECVESLAELGLEWTDPVSVSSGGTISFDITIIP